MKTLVILPGWGGSHETWQQFMDIAKNDFTVVCIDLPCFGTEPCPNTVWGVEEYAQFVQRKLSELGTRNSELVLLGHSFGGQVAAYFAAKHPELIEQLILSGPALFRPSKKIKRLLFGTIAKVGKCIFRLPFIEKFDVAAKKLLYKVADAPDYSQMAGIKQAIFKKIIREDLTSILPKISTPTLLVWGTEDTYTPFANAKRALALLSQAKLHTIEGGKHGLHLQQPEELLRVIKNFVC